MTEDVLSDCGPPDVILTVDDDAATRQLVRCALEASHFRVILAGNAHEAVQVLGNVRVDLILTDSNFPDFDGFELCRMVQSQFGNEVPVLFVTGSVHNLNRHEFDRVGAAGVILKPFRICDLLAGVRLALANRVRGS